ncbi:MAG: sigma-70 family RNA polymerase sigma factor [Clostridia bacterium]|nr:sigma-70 family RNA polymerase sigma factor [Clostridia bacterium]
MTKRDRERTRMLLGVWGRIPARCAEIEREREWTLCRLAQAGVPPELANDDWLTAAEAEQCAWRTLLIELNDELERLALLRERIDGILSALGEPQWTIMRLRYGKGMSYPAIAAKLYYSEDRVRHIKSDTDEIIAREIWGP